MFRCKGILAFRQLQCWQKKRLLVSKIDISFWSVINNNHQCCNCPLLQVYSLVKQDIISQNPKVNAPVWGLGSDQTILNPIIDFTINLDLQTKTIRLVSLFSKDEGVMWYWRCKEVHEAMDKIMFPPHPSVITSNTGRRN